MIGVLTGTSQVHRKFQEGSLLPKARSRNVDIHDESASMRSTNALKDSLPGLNSSFQVAVTVTLEERTLDGDELCCRCLADQMIQEVDTGDNADIIVGLTF